MNGKFSSQTFTLTIFYCANTNQFTLLENLLINLDIFIEGTIILNRSFDLLLDPYKDVFQNSF